MTLLPLLLALVKPSASMLIASGKPAPQSTPAAREGSLLPLHGKSLGTKPVHLYSMDCSVRQQGTGATQQHSAAEGTAAQRMPGAGMEPAAIKPFETVLKDGFYPVGCMADNMFTHGDKFGMNKFSYTMEHINVSIVHYKEHVPAANQEPMTTETCFFFCRSVKDMTFFGIHNGKDCYCTPWFEGVATDDSVCDTTCEGNPAEICGSKVKSSMFGMHACQTTKSDLSSAATTMEGVKTEMSGLHVMGSTLSANMQSAAAEYQGLFGSAGDPAAADLMQSAKVEAGRLQEAAGAVQQVSDEMGSLKTEVDSLAGGDFSQAANVKAGELLIDRLQTATAKGEAASAGLGGLVSAAAASSTAAASAQDAGSQYYPLMYFVDKAYVDAPSTCAGQSAHTAMVGNFSNCAERCNSLVATCVGFSFFPKAGSLAEDEGLCFLMSKFTGVTYYKGCTAPGGFLQVQEHKAAVNTTAVRCAAKFSKFQGTTLKPDPSGKCAQCLKAATGAERCFA